MYKYSVLLVLTFFLKSNCFKAINDRPIIGVLTEEVNSTIIPDAKANVVASYVKFLESGGARVIPIWIQKPVEYYQDIMSKINGVLFPGGGKDLSGYGYGRSGKIIYDIATKMNDNGDFFPLWGTCLGFELLNFLPVNKLWMRACDGHDLATNINFVKGYKDSVLFQDLEPTLEKKMQKKDVVYHFHQWCLTPENYTLSGLHKYFKVLAVNQDKHNLTFVSIVEAHKYPFYGVAFHPEKVLFEWVVSETHQNIMHHQDAVHVSQYFANFFVNEARKSTHHFANKKMEDSVLIYNYNPIFTGQYGHNINMQNYYFI